MPPGQFAQGSLLLRLGHAHVVRDLGGDGDRVGVEAAAGHQRPHLVAKTAEAEPALAGGQMLESGASRFVAVGQQVRARRVEILEAEREDGRFNLEEVDALVSIITEREDAELMMTVSSSDESGGGGEYAEVSQEPRPSAEDGEGAGTRRHRTNPLGIEEEHASLHEPVIVLQNL